MGTLRQRAAQSVDPALRTTQGLSKFNKVAVCVILTAIVTGVLETEPLVSSAYPAIFKSLEAFFFVFFLLEYILRLWCAPENPNHTNRWRFVIRPSSLLDAFLLLGVALSFFGTEGFLFRLLRLFRILRIAKLGRYSDAWDVLSDAIQQRKGELLISFGVSGLVLLVSSAILYLVEGSGQPQAFGSVPRAMWWSVVTLTTVGYGDIVPLTGLGRFFGALVALAGIGTIAMPAGILAGAIGSVLAKKESDAAQNKQMSQNTINETKQHI